MDELTMQIKAVILMLITASTSTVQTSDVLFEEFNEVETYNI
jgi:hypothetical protein